MQAPLSRVVRTMWSMWSIISRRPGALRSFPLEFLARVLEGFLHALERGFGAFHHVRPRVYRSALQPAQLGHRCIAFLAKLLELFHVAILGVAAHRFPMRHLCVPLLDLLLQLLHVLFAVDHVGPPLEKTMAFYPDGRLTRAGVRYSPRTESVCSTTDSAICRSGTVQ